jgi:glycosyltransferase involved in cell wall biosynthesis
VVIAVSETTRRDLQARWGIAEDKIVVAPHGPGQAQCGNERRDPLEAEHFLYVGDDEPRKDLATLRTAHERANTGLPLLIAGSAGQPTSPQELTDHLSKAAALVHPSLYEGFGLTPLEAMHAGTPVIAARSPGVTETCGDAALYVPPRDEDALADAMRRVATDEGLRADLRARGMRRAAAFSWATSARTHLDAYTLAAR